MKGDKVIVRTYGDNPLIRRVWDVEGDTVYICSDRNFERLMVNDSSGSYIGFPREDVFVFDQAWIESETIPALWERLIPY